MKAMDATKITGVGKAVLILGIVSLTMIAFALVIRSMENVKPDVMIGFAVSMGGAILAVTGALYLISAIPVLPLLAAIGKLALVVLAVVGVLAIFGEIGDMGVTASVEKAGALFSAVGSAFGQLIGGFIQGIFKGVSNIGTELSLFMTNLQPFLDGLSKIDATAVTGVQALVDVIKSIAEANISTAISGFLTGRNAVKSFANDMVALGEGISAYATSVKGFGKKRHQGHQRVHRCGKSHRRRSGRPSPDRWVEAGLHRNKGPFQIQQRYSGAGKSTERICNAYQRLRQGKHQHRQEGIRSIGVLGDFAQAIPESGGLNQVFTGTKDITAFSKDLPDLGAAMSLYATHIKGF